MYVTFPSDAAAVTRTAAANKAAKHSPSFIGIPCLCRHAQAVLKVSKEKLDLFFSSTFCKTVASLHDIDQLRSIRAALFNVSSCKLTPPAQNFAAEQTIEVPVELHMRHTDSLRKQNCRSQTTADRADGNQYGAEESMNTRRFSGAMKRARPILHAD